VDSTIGGPGATGPVRDLGAIQRHHAGLDLCTGEHLCTLPPLPSVCIRLGRPAKDRIGRSTHFRAPAFPASRRRRYERLAKFPRGLVALGNALSMAIAAPQGATDGQFSDPGVSRPSSATSAGRGGRTSKPPRTQRSDVYTHQNQEPADHQAEGDRFVVEPSDSRTVTNGMITNPYAAPVAAQYRRTTA